MIYVCSQGVGRGSLRDFAVLQRAPALVQGRKVGQQRGLVAFGLLINVATCGKGPH